MENEKRSSIIKKKIYKRVYILLFLAIVVAGLFYLGSSLEKKVTFKYKENSSLDYSVHLKENDLFPETFLPKDKLYIASLIDYINIDFNYELNFSDDINYLYFYKIEADVNVFEKKNEKNNIYHKNIVLVDTKTFTDETNKELKINELVKVKYDEYNDFIRKFKTNTNIVADSNLKLTMYVTVKGKSDVIEDNIDNVSKVTVVIPLTEQMLEINLDYKDIKNNEVVKSSRVDTILSKITVFAGWFSVALSVIVFISLLTKIYSYTTRQNPYIKRLKQLLREYDRVIVETKNDSSIKDAKNKINVNSFEELLDVSDRIEQPILHLESIKNKRSHFVVRDTDTAYFYVLDENSLEDK